MSTTILITGGSGFLGKNLARKLKDSYKVIITSRNQKQLKATSELVGVESAPSDVSNFFSIDEIIRKTSPEIIIHAAATKFVNLSEKYPNECIDINILGSQNVLRSAIENNVKNVVGISTDKAAAPIANIYGLSKSIMEKLFTSMDDEKSTRFSCVRYGNVAWSTGSVFPIWESMAKNEKLIKSTGPEMSRFFFSIDDAVNLVDVALSNMNEVSGKILSYPMKGVLVKNILDVFSKKYGVPWEVTDSRKGDRPYELLISDVEASFTKKAIFNKKEYFIIDENNRELFNQLTENYSSAKCEQLDEGEIAKLIDSKPSDNFL